MNTFELASETGAPVAERAPTDALARDLIGGR
jgi:hypothetical protein